jgi:hypothetical protein
MDFAPWLIVIVPLVLWALFSLLTREWKRKRLFGLIAGADNRLSLSRLQAFAWTMVIFGTYSAAMWVHPIRVGAEQKKAAQAKVERAVAEEKALDDKWKAAPNDSKIKDQLDKARQNAKAAKTELASYAWVHIPAALLTLAGISLATGVFASALGSGGDGPPIVTDAVVKATAAEDPTTRNPRSAAPHGKYWLLITGSRLGGDGEVRLAGRAARRLFWESDGSAVAVDFDSRRYRTLTIDTKNGKVSYAVAYANGSSLPTAMQLGNERESYELADLVRDDNNPRNLSITKFQMFGWTAIAVTIYIVTFLAALREHGAALEELPVVDATVVMLTGVSQLGYLGGKMASNNNAPPG